MTMNISGHLVDVSPLSTIGALCVASLPAGYNSRRLFNQLLAWGLSMTVVAALICWIFFGLACQFPTGPDSPYRLPGPA